MVVLHEMKRALLHSGLKILWWIERSDPGRQVLPDKKVASSPGDLVAQTGQACCNAGDGTRRCAPMDVARKMNFNAASKVKTALGGCLNCR